MPHSWRRGIGLHRHGLPKYEPRRRDHEFIGSPSVNGATATFTTAFDAWDEASGGAWKLVNGGTISVSTSAYTGINASVDGAGLSPVLFTVSGSQTILKNLVWTQALVINYSPLTGPLAKPEETLDTFSLSQNAAGPTRTSRKPARQRRRGPPHRAERFAGPSIRSSTARL